MASSEFLKNPILFLSLMLLFVYSQAASNITQGQFIQGDQLILSPSENFALGFFSPGNSTNRYIGIWYNTIPIRTIVWVANRENPALNNSSASFTLRTDGNLEVVDGSGRSLWKTNVNTTVATNKSVAMLLDSGNFILSADGGDNPDNSLWQSFNDPTDTYLPGMQVSVSPRSRQHYFTSWKSENDPARGNFSMGLDPTALAQIVVWRGSERRWRSGLWNGQIFIGVPNMTANYLYGFHTTVSGGRTYMSYTVHNITELVRFRLRWDGIEQQILWNEGSDQWTTFWGQPTRACEFYNVCGAFGSCSTSGSSRCTCLRGFEPKSETEWGNGNWSGGCIRRNELQCGRNITTAGEEDRFLELDGLKLPDFALQISSNDRNHCANLCSNNCSCMAYAYVSGLQCLTWSQDFIDIQKFQEGGQKLYIRLASAEFGGSKKNSTLIIIIVVVVIGIILLCISAIVFWRCRRKSKVLRTKLEKETVEGEETKSNEFWSTRHDGEGNPGNGPELPMHSFQDMLNATNNFSSANKLGEGGFGPVYKGKLSCGLDVAVKRLSRKSGQGLEEFKNEIILIAKLQHRNLVRLLGYCVEGEEKMLVYEYLPNKSLDAFIFANPQEHLNWEKRFNIIEGIARGLLYLHRDSRLRIIHRDMKASNILLDEEMNPKISDFGMAKIFGGNQNQANTNRVVGTYGYMAPEYAMEGLFSVKSDVYSFGVLLLEIISGKKNQFRDPENSANLIGYAWKLWGEERAMEFIDPTLRSSCSQSNALRCINVGLLCVQDSAMDRPIMSTVVLMLESDTAVLPTPRQPTFTMGRSPLDMELLSLDSSEVLTKNSLTNTTVVGR